MVSLLFVFYLFIGVFALIGAMRGWAKELLVSFSVILALAFIQLLEQYVLLKEGGQFTMNPQDESLFWVRIITLFVLVFFGYQTVNIPKLSSKAARERLQDFLLGMVLGAINGYLVMGSVWAYLAEANYPFTAIVDPNACPTLQQAYLNTAETLLHYMPPTLLGVPGIYFAVIISFIFVIVVYV